jgi:hypothetical protein
VTLVRLIAGIHINWCFTTIDSGFLFIAFLVNLGLLNIRLLLFACSWQGYEEITNTSIICIFLAVNMTEKLQNTPHRQIGAGIITQSEYNGERYIILLDIFCHISPSFFAISVVGKSGLLLFMFCIMKTNSKLQLQDQICNSTPYTG